MGRLRLYGSMVAYARKHNLDFAREHYAFFERMRQDLQPLIGNLAGQRVLDVGCGKSYWLTLLLHSCGADVTGIDTEFVDQGLLKYWRIFRRNGLDRALRTIAWEQIYAPPYYRALALAAPFPLIFGAVDVRCESVTDLTMPDESLDLAVSHEVFEHFDDLDSALRCLRRKLKPTGLTYFYIHNYTSISGGHHIAWKYPDTEPSPVVPPWDHLRQNRFPDIPSYINRLRERDYRAAFEAHFDIVHWLPGKTEGAALLTPQIRAELADYSEAELLTKGFTVVARPQPNR